jgi:pilus assembly protein Flp/PilA
MYCILVQILKEDAGSSAAEYGLVTGLIAIVVITGILFAGNSVGGFINYIGNQVSSALPSSGGSIR